MAAPIVITRLEAVLASTVRVNILANIPQRIVDEDSVVDVALSREVVGLTHSIEIGNEIAMPGGSLANLNTTNGTLPTFKDDNVGRFAAAAGQEIAVFVNSTDAATKEFRLQMRITALDDLALLPSNVA